MIKIKKIHIFLFTLTIFALGLAILPIKNAIVIKADSSTNESFIITRRYTEEEGPPSQLSDIPNEYNTAALYMGYETRYENYINEEDGYSKAMSNSYEPSIIIKLSNYICCIERSEIYIEFEHEYEYDEILNTMDAFLNLTPKKSSTTYTIEFNIPFSRPYWFNYLQIYSNDFSGSSNNKIKNLEMVPKENAIFNKASDYGNTSIFGAVNATLDNKPQLYHTMMDIPIYNNFNEISNNCQTYYAKYKTSYSDTVKTTSISWKVVNGKCYPEMSIASLIEQAVNEADQKSYYVNKYDDWYGLTQYYKLTGYLYDTTFNFTEDLLITFNYEIFDKPNSYTIHFLAGEYNAGRGEDDEILSYTYFTFYPEEDLPAMYEHEQQQIKLAYQDAYEYLVKYCSITSENLSKEFIGWSVPYEEGMKPTTDIYVKPMYEFKQESYDVKLYDENKNYVTTLYDIKNGTKILDLDLSAIIKEKNNYTFKYLLTSKDGVTFDNIVDEDSIITKTKLHIMPKYTFNENAVRINIYTICVEPDAQENKSNMITYCYELTQGEALPLPIAPYYDHYTPDFWTISTSINQSNYEEVKSNMIGLYGLKEYIIPTNTSKWISITLVYKYDKNPLIIDKNENVELNDDEKNNFNNNDNLSNEQLTKLNKKTTYIVLGSVVVALSVGFIILLSIRRKRHEK